MGDAADPAVLPEGRALGLDHGDARIGVAISDPQRTMAVPLGTVHTGAPADLKAISALVRDQGVVVVVLGLPLSMSGARGPRASHVQAFADALRAVLDVPVLLQDERLSTAEAERALAAAGVSARERKRSVDRSAATVILQAWLDRHIGERSRPSGGS
ncbi:MAG: Holliday junction resolvase RuvX [Actinomycetota bacterium]